MKIYRKVVLLFDFKLTAAFLFAFSIILIFRFTSTNVNDNMLTDIYSSCLQLFHMFYLQCLLLINKANRQIDVICS